MRFLLLVFIAIVSIQVAKCARILGIFHTPGYSHFVLGETVFKELAARGHEVTVISANPQKETLKNYRDVTIQELIEFSNSMRNNQTAMMALMNTNGLPILFIVAEFGLQMTEITLQNENVQNLLNSNETFDLIILEQFLNEAHFGFMHHFKAPLISFFTSIPALWTNDLMGNPTPYSYVPNVFSDFPPKMNFWQRVCNTFFNVVQTLHFHAYVLPRQNTILHKYFPDAPPIQDLIYNASLLFLNSHPTLSAPVPLLPNMIEIGGFHVKNDKPLQEDLKKFLDEAKEGVVYLSLGSNMQSKFLPKEKVNAFIEAFSKLKMKVLWKFEEDLPGKPANVRIEKWLPQPAVLAHKNVKLFMSHGGRLSTIESVYFGKPILGIPLSAEQHANIQEAVQSGYALHVSYRDLSAELLTDSLKELIENPKYVKEVQYRSNALKDLQVSQLDKAIYWVEYVIKYGGVHHLKNSGLDLAWYQYLLLDVILFYLIVIWIIKRILFAVFSKLFKKSKTQKGKVKTN